MLAVKHFKPPIESSAINCLFLVLFLSDNIPSDTLSGNESQHGIQSISKPHGPSDGFDAWAAAQHSPARPWESYWSGSHGKWHLRTKTCAHRQAGGMQPACSCCVSMFCGKTLKGECWSVLPPAPPGLQRIPARELHARWERLPLCSPPGGGHGGLQRELGHCLHGLY